MKANELRIGNLVWEDYGGIYEILMISPNYVDLIKPLMSASGRYDIDSIEPIPLTDEWMLKLGCICMPWGWVINGVVINWHYSIDDGFSAWIELKDGNIIKLPYVHTLQNFFALTGEELLCQ